MPYVDLKKKLPVRLPPGVSQKIGIADRSEAGAVHPIPPAVFWGMVILGSTGLLLAYPLSSSRLLPGWTLNVALWIHRIEALLAMGHVFIIHFFIGHLRRHNFPMDRAIFEGSVDLDATRHEKPNWIFRLEEKGSLSNLLVSEAGKRQQTVFYLFGFAAMAFGLYLLIGGLINSLQVTW